MAPDVFQEAIRLREHVILVLAYREMHVVEGAQLVRCFGRADNDTVALRFVDRAVGRIVKSAPQGIHVRAEIQAMPFRLLHQAESRIAERNLVVQAPDGD